MCYKTLHNLVNVNYVNFFGALPSYIRGNIMKLNKPRIIAARDGHFFTNCTVNLWNSLPDSITVPTASCFSRLDELLL